jgi:hypothetical protein
MREEPFRDLEACQAEKGGASQPYFSIVCSFSHQQVSQKLIIHFILNVQDDLLSNHLSTYDPSNVQVIR